MAALRVCGGGLPCQDAAFLFDFFSRLYLVNFVVENTGKNDNSIFSFFVPTILFEFDVNIITDFNLFLVTDVMLVVLFELFLICLFKAQN